MNVQGISKLLVAAVVLAFAAPVSWAQDAGHAEHADAATVQAPQLQQAMRDLWRGHINTTRDYALAVHADDAAAADKAADAVVDNAKQIAAAVAGFYGEAGGNGIMELLAGHWQGVKALTDAAKAGDKDAENTTLTELANNATAIAQFLAGANPYLPVDAVRGALVMHSVDHKSQVDMMMSNAPEEAQAAAWARMQEHMDMIADTLSAGIAKQFPDKVQ